MAFLRSGGSQGGGLSAELLDDGSECLGIYALLAESDQNGKGGAIQFGVRTLQVMSKVILSMLCNPVLYSNKVILNELFNPVLYTVTIKL